VFDSRSRAPRAGGSSGSRKSRRRARPAQSTATNGLDGDCGRKKYRPNRLGRHLGGTDRPALLVDGLIVVVLELVRRYPPRDDRGLRVNEPSKPHSNSRGVAASSIRPWGRRPPPTSVSGIGQNGRRSYTFVLPTDEPRFAASRSTETPPRARVSSPAESRVAGSTPRCATTTADGRPAVAKGGPSYACIPTAARRRARRRRREARHLDQKPLQRCHPLAVVPWSTG